MINIKKILFEISEDEKVFDENIDLIESGILDSYGMMELLAVLEDEGVEINITRTDRNIFRSADEIEKLVTGSSERK